MTTSSRSRRLGLLVLAAALPLSLVTAGVASADVARAGAAQVARADQPWLNTSLTPEERAALLIDAMTLAQKFQQLTGTPPEIVPELPECYGGRHVRGIPELGIPTLRITNGPVGVGQNDCVDAALIELPPAQRPLGVPYVHHSSAKATALPSATTAAASFDPDVAGTYGDVIGTEMNNLALHVFEAPGVNMARLPILGRNFEYFGEDPFLAGTMAVAETKAVQDKGLIAMPKHYAANEQETNRQVTNSVVDERTLHEIVPAAVRDGGQGWRRRLDHVRVQLRQRRALVRERVPAGGRAAGAVGFPGLRAVGLLRHEEHRPHVAKRHGPHDAGSSAVGSCPAAGGAGRWADQRGRHRPRARTSVRADVQVRHLRPAAGPDADRLRRRW